MVVRLVLVVLETLQVQHQVKVMMVEMVQQMPQLILVVEEVLVVLV
jgi:hypothetical protein